ncbi:MAG: hypothetical protein JNM56_07275 [Planctomycetia bacterium]|nr:hypothetical protein [Planctomycetia bacterium]
MAYQTAGWALLVLKKPEDAAAQADLVREVFGNPFRPVKCLPRWRSEVVVEPAQHIYDGHSFKRRKRLAEALENSGCDNAAMLDHCRQPGEHVRGCWCVDLILSKDR